jgi:hypothetical protein
MRTSKEIANLAIGSVVEWCASNRGGVSRICDAVESEFGLRIQRPQMSRYVAKNPAKRVEPQLGTGLAIMSAFASVTGKQ